MTRFGFLPEPSYMNTQTCPVLVTMRHAAELLGISVRTVQNLIAAKELPSRKIGRRRLIPYSALQALARRDAQTGNERGEV